MLRMVLPGKNEPSNSLSESYILTLLGKKVQTFEVEVEGYLSSFKITNIFARTSDNSFHYHIDVHENHQKKRKKFELNKIEEVFENCLIWNVNLCGEY